MENEIENLKKNLSKLDKLAKDNEQKLQKYESELKCKQEEIDSLKNIAESNNDPNKVNLQTIDELRMTSLPHHLLFFFQPDLQLVYAMAYQDKLYIEVERVKSSFEIEIIKLQEYYESRIAHFRNQGFHPGPFMGVQVGNSFPKGCVVTPLNIGQAMQVVSYLKISLLEL